MRFQSGSASSPQLKSGEPIPDAFFVLQDLVTEALQLLQAAGLVMQRSYKVNQDRTYSQWLSGLVTTRRGRAPCVPCSQCPFRTARADTHSP